MCEARLFMYLMQMKQIIPADILQHNLKKNNKEEQVKHSKNTFKKMCENKQNAYVKKHTVIHFFI